MSTTPLMDAALSGPNPLVFGALRIDLNDGRVVRLLDGTIALAGPEWSQYLGRDPVFGAVDSIEEFSDGAGDESPGMSFTLIPASDAGAGDLAAADMQGSKVRFWLGVVLPDGTVVPDPYLLGAYRLDVPTLTADTAMRTLEFECVSAFEGFQEQDEGQRLNDTFHQSVWPGETGLFNVTGIESRDFWGAEPPRSSINYGGY